MSNTSTEAETIPLPAAPVARSDGEDGRGHGRHVLTVAVARPYGYPVRWAPEEPAGWSSAAYARPPGTATAVGAAIEKCLGGDAVACEQFYASYDSLAARVLRRRFPRMTSADRADVASAALEGVLVALKKGRVNGTSDGELRAYMWNAVKNAALDLVTRKRVAQPGWSPEQAARCADTAASPERRAIARALSERVEQVLSRWPAADRHIFLQKVSGVSSATIRSDLARWPFCLPLKVASIDTRYWRLRQLLIRALEDRPPAV